MSRAPSRERIRTRLADQPGVLDLDLETLPDLLGVRVDPAASSALLEAGIRALLSADARGVPEIAVSLAPAYGGEPERSRLSELNVAYPMPGRIAVTATLEWGQRTWRGEAEGERNPNSELRVSASAVLRALESITDGAASFSLIGAKELQVFDHNLVVLLIHCVQLPDPRLIGTAIMREDRCRSAAVAVLNATNRVMGRWTQL